MAVKLNQTGVSHAKSLIKAGKVDKDSSWSFSTEDENKILGDDNWSEYKKWFLAVDDEENEDTKAHYRFPYGKNGKVYRRGVIAAKQRAAQQGYSSVEKAADELLQMIDKDKDEKSSETEKREGPPINTAFNRTFQFDARGGVLDAENRIVELSFSSEEPVQRWFGREILLHNQDSVDVSPLVNVGAVLLNHDPNQIIGKPIRVWIDEDTRKGKAIIQFGNTDEGKKAFENVKEGLLRGVSVGYIVDKWKVLDENEEWERFSGPADIATKWRVLEISLTPVPADSNVGVGRTIKTEEEKTMEKEKREESTIETPTPNVETKTISEEEIRAQERKRIQEIEAMGERFGMSDLAKELIEKGTGVDEARKIIMDKLMEQPENKPVGARIELGESEREKVRDAMLTGLMVRAGFESAEKANNFTGMTLLEIAKRSLEVAGVSITGLSKLQLVSRAITHTSSDFPLILQNIAHKAILDGFNAQSETWSTWCATGSVSDFKIHTAVRAGELDDLEEVPEGAEYKHFGRVAEQQEQYKISKYGKIFTITREAIINDDLHALTAVPRNMGEAAARKIGDLAYGVLIDNPIMGDGKPLFDTSHKNIASSGSAPTLDAIKSAVKAMKTQKDIGGKRRLNIRPQFIIVPMSLEDYVEEELGTQYLDHNQGKPNVLRKYNLTVVGDGRLDDAGTAWYLAGPKGKTVTIFFLDGNQTPTIEQQQGFDVDGVKYKVRIEAGAKAMHWKALYKNPGA